MDYTKYLESPHWKEFRQEVLDFWEYRCAICYEPGEHVHHRTYYRLGHEKLSDCIVLCASCHLEFHEKLSQVTTFEQWAAEQYGDDWRDWDQDYIWQVYQYRKIFSETFTDG